MVSDRLPIHLTREGGDGWRAARTQGALISALTPILRFADVEGFVQEATEGTALAAFCQIGVAKEEQPHYLRVISRPEHDPSELIAYGMSVIADRRRVSLVDRATRSQPSERGLISAVRTYESPLDRRFEELGFENVASVSLLMKESAIRVYEPAFAAVTTN